MADERYSEYQENESPERHVNLYASRLEDMGVTRADLYIALENLVMQELNIDDEAASKLIQKTGLPDILMGLERDDSDDISRIEAELFSMAPLLLLWSAIRDTRATTDAHVWLDAATKLALTEAEFHDGSECSTANMPIKNECEYSQMCPSKTALRVILWQALLPPDEDGLDALFVDPKTALHMIRVEVMVAGRNNLITKAQGKSVMQYYLEQRHSQAGTEESPE